MRFNFQLKAQNPAHELLTDRKNRRWATSQSLDDNGEQVRAIAN
ncbi:MAG: hypothetical protein RMZ41_002105 [Nostoc sp. DedVER02]|nr:MULTISPECIES: hypothetical protein [unclassified Nostoc]MDZ7987048.1 hypothetical protein [Nostoc sp. DedVER02]MDZ8116565.1 hypothetical protein [Nostoc sp. DedVER01b]